MELDELKNILNQAADRGSTRKVGLSFKTGRAFDPFRPIKKRALWIFLFFAVATVIFFPSLSGKKNTSAVILYLILAVEPFISLVGYLLISHMNRFGENIKQDLLIRVRLLRSVFRSYIFLNAFSYIFLACAIEYLITIQKVNIPGFDKIALPIRLVLYLVFIGFQYWQKRRSYQKNYGAYLSSVIDLLNQTHE